MPEVEIDITMMSGMQVFVKMEDSLFVRDIKAAAEEQLAVEPHTSLKLVCNGNVLLPSMPVDSLESRSLFGTITREQDVQVLKQAASSYAGYVDLMEKVSIETFEHVKMATTGDVPTILDVLETMGGERKELPNLAQMEDGKLRFWGRNGELLMPALKAGPLQKALDVEVLEEVTIIMTCNSDCYNQGLGVGVEASPLMNTTMDEKGIPSYMYNGYGLNTTCDEHESEPTTRRNVIKFHPGMHGGQLRVEGVGGWGNCDVGFRPASLSAAEGSLHELRITLRTSGINTIQFKGVIDSKGVNHADALQVPAWSKNWNRELFDGHHIPALFAFLDLGSSDQKGVVYGRIFLEARGGSGTSASGAASAGAGAGACVGAGAPAVAGAASTTGAAAASADTSAGAGTGSLCTVC